MRATAFIAFAAAMLAGAAAHAQVTALTHATLIDGSGAPPQAGVTVVIENGRIPDLGPGMAAPPGATRIDGTRQVIRPGHPKPPRPGPPPPPGPRPPPH